MVQARGRGASGAARGLFCTLRVDRSARALRRTRRQAVRRHHQRVPEQVRKPQPLRGGGGCHSWDLCSNKHCPLPHSARWRGGTRRAPLAGQHALALLGSCGVGGARGRRPRGWPGDVRAYFLPGQHLGFLRRTRRVGAPRPRSARKLWGCGVTVRGKPQGKRRGWERGALKERSGFGRVWGSSIFGLLAFCEPRDCKSEGGRGERVTRYAPRDCPGGAAGGGTLWEAVKLWSHFPRPRPQAWSSAQVSLGNRGCADRAPGARGL